LRYAIPATVIQALRTGQDVIANLSRAVLPKADQVFDDMRVLHVTARPEVLAARLRGRGRENPAEVARRLSRPAPALPAGLDIVRIDNSGALDRVVDAACAALYPVNA
jgi:ribose 1,5-bisphosphokinase